MVFNFKHISSMSDEGKHMDWNVKGNYPSTMKAEHAFENTTGERELQV